MTRDLVGKRVIVVSSLPPKYGTVVEVRSGETYPVMVAVDGSLSGTPVPYSLAEVLIDSD